MKTNSSVSKVDREIERLKGKLGDNGYQWEQKSLEDKWNAMARKIDEIIDFLNGDSYD